MVALDPETGGWCGRCFLPSLVQIRVFMLWDEPLMVALQGVITYCDQHDEEPRWESQ